MAETIQVRQSSVFDFVLGILVALAAWWWWNKKHNAQSATGTQTPGNGCACGAQSDSSAMTLDVNSASGIGIVQLPTTVPSSIVNVASGAGSTGIATDISEAA